MTSAARVCALDGCGADLDALGLKEEAIYCSRGHKAAAKNRRQRAAQKLARREASVVPPMVEAPTRRSIDPDQGPIYEDVGQMILDAARMDRQATADARRRRYEDERAAREAGDFHARALKALEHAERAVGVIV